MRFHRLLCDAVADCVADIFINNRNAEVIIAQKLKSNKNWGARDRAFIAENTFEIVRWWRMLCYKTGFSNRSVDKDACHSITGFHFYTKYGERTGFSKFDNFMTEQDVQLPEAIRLSVTDWFYEKGLSECGERWPVEIEAMNRQAPIYIRVNTLKTTPDKLGEIFTDQGIPFSPVEQTPDAFILEKRVNLAALKSYQDGLFEVQDIGSQAIGAFLAPAPGSVVVDACAGAGGKTLHLASLMSGSGRILALDIVENKLKELEKRAARAAIKIIKPKTITGPDIIGSHQEYADYLLIDAPCSGTGVLKRNPDTKWKLNADKLAEAIQTQQYILDNYTRMLKKGGTLVYATCSLWDCENTDQVKRLTEIQAFDLQEEKTIWPSEMNADGFYMARLVKK